MQQLDIFRDSHEVTLANEVIAALSAHDGDVAAQSIARLRAVAPERPDLPCFDKLGDFLRLFQRADFSALDPDAIETVVDVLSATIIPCARVLGHAGKGFLAFFWLRLARAASAPFDPERPQLHAAELFLRAEAYEETEQAASSIVEHPTHRAVLRWRAIARYRRAGLTGARLQIFLLAWHAPDSFADLLDELGDAQLRKRWLALQADLEDLDASWLPAWELLRHPTTALIEIAAQLTSEFDERSARAEPESIPAMQAYLLLARILDLEESGHSRRLVAQRARLQALDAGFFAAYMRSRAVGHP